MKILITTGIFPPDIGGPATYVWEIKQEFTRLGNEVRIITYSDDKNTDDDSIVYRVKRGKNIFWRYFKYFLRVFFTAYWADVVYIQDSVSAGFPATLANLIWRKKAVLKVVGDFAWEQAQNQYGIRDSLDAFQHQKYDFKIELWRKIERWVAARADRIITPSQYLKRIVRCWGVAEEKVEVVYNAFDEPDYIDDNIKMPQGDVIFTAGRLVPWKGMDTLIKIMPDLLKQNSRSRLVIVGDGPEKKNLEKLIASLNLSDKVFLMGKMPREKLLGYLKNSKVFILNSSYEGLSHQVLEALWLGVPTSVSRVGGNPEVIEQGKNGLLFEYNNTGDIKECILRLFRDRQLADEFIKTGKSISQIFNQEKMINQTLKVLRSI